MATLYETDFSAWSKDQATFLRKREFQNLDIQHLVEEIEDLGKTSTNAIQSHMKQIIAHLLKCEFQPAYYTKSWQDTIDAGRDEIENIIEDNPSLKTYPETVVEISYIRAVRLAAKQTGLDIRIFPKQCPWDLKYILNEEEEKWPHQF